MDGADRNVYESLAEAAGNEERWAFGTGFTDPLAGVDTRVLDGIDATELARQCLALGDDALVLAQRLAGWCSNAPELEDELALANIALDLLGQARMLLTRAAQADPELRPPAAPGHVPDEDALAYFRDERAFTNVRLVELDDEGDFAVAIARLLGYITWRLAALGALRAAPDPVLAAIATKAVPELSYHRDYAAAWAVRLGAGTENSHARMHAALERVWPYLPELFDGTPEHREEFDAVLEQVLDTAGLARPQLPARAGVGGRTGRDGVHTEAMGYVLAELQGVARAHPEATW